MCCCRSTESPALLPRVLPNGAGPKAASGVVSVLHRGRRGTLTTNAAISSVTITSDDRQSLTPCRSCANSRAGEHRPPVRRGNHTFMISRRPQEHSATDDGSNAEASAHRQMNRLSGRSVTEQHLPTPIVVSHVGLNPRGGQSDAAIHRSIPISAGRPRRNVGLDSRPVADSMSARRLL